MLTMLLWDITASLSISLIIATSEAVSTDDRSELCRSIKSPESQQAFNWSLMSSIFVRLHDRL